MKYLTAEKLGITTQEREALLKVKRFLKTLKLPKDLLSLERNLGKVAEEAPALFYMNRAVSHFDCGTAGCVGGWMSLYMQGIPLKNKVAIPIDVAVTAENYVRNIRHGGPLTQLFYPQNFERYDYITPQHAVAEIETFLRTGKATW